MEVINLIGSRKEVFFVTTDTTVHEAARYLREKQVRAVGVRIDHTHAAATQLLDNAVSGDCFANHR